MVALDNDNTEQYMNSLNRSLALVLDEFYRYGTVPVRALSYVCTCIYIL